VQTFVWVDSWQQQCCGDDFSVGSSVHWNVHRLEGGDKSVAELVGPEWGAAVEYSSNHHGVDDHLGPGDEMQGVVLSIRVMTCGRQPQPDRNPGGQMWVRVPGSGQLREVRVADPWEPEPPAEEHHVSFEGWIVEVETDSLV
jgi:hypothetical protein